MDNSGLFINKIKNKQVYSWAAFMERTKTTTLGNDMNYSGGTKVVRELHGWGRWKFVLRTAEFKEILVTKAC